MISSQGLLSSVCGTYQQPTISSHFSLTSSIGICPVFRSRSYYRKNFPIVIGAILCMQQTNFGHFSNTTYKRSRGVRTSCGVETKSFLGSFKGAPLYESSSLPQQACEGGTTEKEERGSLPLSNQRFHSVSYGGGGRRGGRERESKVGARFSRMRKKKKDLRGNTRVLGPSERGGGSVHS